MDAESLREIGITSPGPTTPATGFSSAPQSTPVVRPPVLDLTGEVNTNTVPAPVDQTPTSSKGKNTKKAASAKRKTNQTSAPRSERLKQKMANQDINREPMQVEQTTPCDGTPSFDLQSYLDQQFLSVRAEMKDSVKDIASQVASNSKKIADMDAGLDARVAVAVSREVQKITKEINEIKAGGNNGNQTTDDSTYWRARRSVRVWPIRCRDNDLWGAVGDFFYDTLQIPKNNLQQNSVESIRRIGTAKRRNPSRIQDEVLVVFADCSTRDMIFSYASNLSRFKNAQERPGIRLDIPDQLRGVFGDLERYGADLRKNLGPELRRSIKFEDSHKTMYIDVLFPGDEKWTRVPHSLAREQLDTQEKKTHSNARERLSSISSNFSSNQRTPVPSTQNNQPPRSETLQRFVSSGPPSRWSSKT